MKNKIFIIFQIIIFFSTSGLIVGASSCMLLENLSFISNLQKSVEDDTVSATLNTENLHSIKVCETCNRNISTIAKIIEISQGSNKHGLGNYGKHNIFIYSNRDFANEYPILKINDQRYVICRDTNSSKLVLIPCNKVKDLGTGFISNLLLFLSPSFKYQLLLQRMVTDLKICDLIRNKRVSFENVEKSALEVSMTLYDLFHSSQSEYFTDLF